jgi:hypothetical protein
MDLEHGDAVRRLDHVAAHLLRWSTDSTRIGVAEFHDATVYPVDGGVPDRRHFEQLVLDVAIEASRTTYNTTTGVFVAKGGRLAALTTPDRADAGTMLHDLDGTALLPHGDRIEVFDPERRFALVSPAGPLGSVASAHNGRRVVALTPGHLLVWDLTSRYPKTAQFPRITSFGLAGSNTAVMLQLDGTWVWLDFAKRRGSPIPELTLPFAQFAFGLHDTLAATMPHSERPEVWVLRGPHAVVVHEAADDLAVLADDRVAMVTHTGEIVIYGADNQRHVLASHAATVADLATSGGWLAVAYRDGLVYRFELATGRQETLQLALGGMVTLSVALDGTVLVGVGRGLMRWQRDGLLLLHAMLPMPITAQYSLSHHASVTTSDSGSYSITLDAPAHIATLPANVTGWLAYTTELGVYQNPDGTLRMADLADGSTWPLARPQIGIARAPALADDGRHVAAMIDAELYLWEPEIPLSREDTAHWLDTLTNATAELGTASLAFREVLQPAR